VIVEQLDVNDVRNIEAAQIALDSRATLFVGPNGAGKTTVLEAIHLLIRGRSFRTSRADGVIRNDQDRMAVGASLTDPHLGSMRLGYVRNRNGRTELRRDGQVVRQTSDVAGLLPVQLLLPDLPELVFGGPTLRRRWLDWGAFHVKPAYAATSREYLRALRHRNVILRSGDLRTLPAWTSRVAELGESIADSRREYFGTVRHDVLGCLGDLSPGLDVEMTYLQGWAGKNLEESLGQQLDRDVKLGNTQAGPHRADVGLRCGSDVAATVLSRGQGKALACAMRLGQAKDLARAGKPSLFLIDDLGAELDERHNERYYGLLEDMACQIVATSTHGEVGEVLMKSGPGSTFHVKHGHFERAG